MKRSRVRLVPAVPAAPAVPNRFDAMTSPVMMATQPGSADEGGGVHRAVFMGDEGHVAEAVDVSWTEHRQPDALRNPDGTDGDTGSRRTPVTAPAPAATGNWPALPGRWPLSRSAHDNWLRLDLARLDAEQRLV
jgi:hypothetical protein